MGSTPHALRRDTALRVVGKSDARHHMASTEAEIRQLTRETLRVVGWEYEIADRALAWHAPIGSILAISPRDVVSVSASNGIEPTTADIADWIVAPIVTTLQAGAPWRDYELQQRLESTTGDVQHFLVRARQVRENGRVIGCAGLVVDISDRQLVEANMRELIDRYRRLVDLSPDGIVVHQGGRVVYVNRAGVGLIGARDFDDLLGRSIIDFVHTDSLGPTLERIAQLTDDAPVSEPAEAALVRFDGAPLSVESVSVLTRWEGEDAYQVILRDLTDRKLAEAALRYQASLVEHVSDAIIGIDVHGRVESWNHAAEIVYGVTSEDAVGSLDPRSRRTARRVRRGAAARRRVDPHASRRHGAHRPRVGDRDLRRRRRPDRLGRRVCRHDRAPAAPKRSAAWSKSCTAPSSKPSTRASSSPTPRA